MTIPRRQLRRAAVATSLALAVAAAGGRALAAAPTSYAVGGVPSVAAGATPLGTLPTTTSLPLTVVLAPRDAAGMAALATAVSTPGSPQFHHFLSVAQVAARFGATPASVSAVQSTLRAQGLTPGALAPDRLSLAVSGTVAQASQAFGVTLRRYREASGRQVFANTTAARVPGALRGVVAGVLGLDDLPAAVPASLVRDRGEVRRTALAPAASASANTDETLCTPATSRRGVGGPYTIDQIAGAYGMNGLYADGDVGSGVTIALYELEPYSASDLAHFQSCLSPPPTGAVTNIPVDGGPCNIPPGEETALDLDNVIGIAPASNVSVYQGPNEGAGIYDTFAAIVNADAAEVISDSWGVCEPSGSVGAFAMENTLFEQAAMQGQTILVAAGDSGSTGCSTAKVPNSTIAVDDAASQPWVTGVGGTALTALGSPPIERVWNDGANDAGGGGISSVWAMPNWQKGLGINGQSSATPCASGLIGDPTAGPDCREVPDVSADASPATGYIIYFGGWQQVGGTSAGAPLWAGLTALADASHSGTCSPTTPLGFLNPTLYAIAAGSGAGKRSTTSRSATTIRAARAPTRRRPATTWRPDLARRSPRPEPRLAWSANSAA
jgi:subtilase family serine protease